jgi:hypothetical protein
VYACSKDFSQKVQPELMALAFHNLKPGQSCGQSMTLTWLGLAYGMKLGMHITSWEHGRLSGGHLTTVKQHGKFWKGARRKARKWD